jgi:hypothetical protein
MAWVEAEENKPAEDREARARNCGPQEHQTSREERFFYVNR